MLIEFPYRILKIVKQAVESATHGTLPYLEKTVTIYVKIISPLSTKDAIEIQRKLANN